MSALSHALSDPASTRNAYPCDRPLHVRRRLSFFAAGVASYVLAVLLSRLPTIAETAYGSTVGPLLSLVLSWSTGWIPLAVGELLAVTFIARQAVGGSIAVRDVLRRKRRMRNAAGAATLRLAQDLGAVVALFYLLWGFHYSRPPVTQRLGWQLPTRVSVEELRDLVEDLVLSANDAYREIHGTDDADTPTVLPHGRQPIQAMLRDGWNDARIELGLKVQSGRYGAVKTPLFTPLYEWAGVAGFYFPFTGEANLRSGIPAVDVPKMLAHEMAHQRGVAPESEANFWGFLAAVNAANPHARYSALVFAQRQLMLGLMRQAPDTVARLVQLRSPGVQRDIDDAREYWMRFSGRGTRIGTAVNDAYLRSNRVVGGVENYSHSALLFIAYARARDGKLVD